MSQKLRQLLRRVPQIRKGRVSIVEWLDKLWPIRGKNNSIEIKGIVVRLNKSIFGDNNSVRFGNSVLIDCAIRIRGNNNVLIIEDGCVRGKGCGFWLEGNNNTIVIKGKVTMAQFCYFNAQEHGTKIVVGEDYMFSNTIIVRTSGHPIFSRGVRVNPANDVEIGKHVWVDPSSVIMKGAQIGDGTIVGSHTMVNKPYQAIVWLLECQPESLKKTFIGQGKILLCNTSRRSLLFE